jgi:hypothetical protein
VVAREVRRHVHVRGHSVETELVALDVLHHEARLVVARVPRRARPVVRIRPQVRPGALHPRARCRPARQDAADSSRPCLREHAGRTVAGLHLRDQCMRTLNPDAQAAARDRNRPK